MLTAEPQVDLGTRLSNEVGNEPIFPRSVVQESLLAANADSRQVDHVFWSNMTSDSRSFDRHRPLADAQPLGKQTFNVELIGDQNAAKRHVGRSD